MTRTGMVAEQVVRAFWPLWTAICIVTAPLLLGWQYLVTGATLFTLAVVAALCLVGTLIWGVRKFQVPSTAAAMRRVDARLKGRPIAALTDQQAIGTGDAASVAVWQAHVARMQEQTRTAQPVAPDLRVAERDPYGIRLVALLFLSVAMLFGTAFRGIEPPAIAGVGNDLASGPIWEGWVAPPSYTGKPSIYLNDIPAGTLRVPIGSTVTLRLYGDQGALAITETVSGRVDGGNTGEDAQQTFDITQDGKLAIDGGNGPAWDVIAVLDQPPLVELTGPIEAEADGEMSQPFLVIDDYGVTSGTATFSFDIAAVSRVHGLAVEPDGFEDLVLDLPMPFNGDRTDFEDFVIDNLSQHPLANLPVTMTLEVVDAAGQTASTPPEALLLPGRRFFQPFARAIIEQRRDLMWARANAVRVSQIMKAISLRPEGLFSNETTYLRMRAVIRQLDAFAGVEITPQGQEEIVAALWDLAIQLEDGTLADARERLRRAQERLSEAMRNGASDEEIAELMQELRAATDDYMQLLADETDFAEQNQTDQPDDGENNSFEFSQDELQALMDRIQELMQEGRMAEAEELMEQLNQLLENMRITQGEGGGDGPQTPGQQSMQDLADTLRDQEDLSDDAFRELQDRAQQGQQGQQQQGAEPGPQGEQQPQEQTGQADQQQSGSDGAEGGSGDQQSDVPSRGDDGQEDAPDGGEDGNQSEERDGSSLSDRQQALRDELNRQRGALPGLDGEAGDIARRALERAESAMDNAERALREGDLAEAIDRQAEAMDALRNGMRTLSDALAGADTQDTGQDAEQAERTGRVAPGRRDPLGRELGNGRQSGSQDNLLQGDDVDRRAEELLNELRRRAAEQDRPEIEKDYLRRLLDRF